MAARERDASSIEKAIDPNIGNFTVDQLKAASYWVLDELTLQDGVDESCFLYVLRNFVDKYYQLSPEQQQAIQNGLSENAKAERLRPYPFFLSQKQHELLSQGYLGPHHLYLQGEPPISWYSDSMGVKTIGQGTPPQILETIYHEFIDASSSRQIIVLPPRICEVSSKKRQQVISLVALGATNAQIAEEMGIANRTVDVHLGTLFSELGLSGKEEIISWFWKQKAEFQIPSAQFRKLSVGLTEAEQDIAGLVVRGFSDKDICSIRCNSIATVRTHINSVLAKCALPSRKCLLSLFYSGDYYKDMSV